MKFSTNIKPISYLKAHTTEVADALAQGGSPLVITQDGEATMVIQDVRAYEQKEEVLALLKILALGNLDAQAGKGMSAADFRQQLAAFEPGEKVACPWH